jgi:hypothetical protein
MAQPIKLDWLVTEKDWARKIRDVIIDGLSLSAPSAPSSRAW